MKYQGDIFVSTGAFGRTDIEDILVMCQEAGIQNLELSSGAGYRSDKLLDVLNSHAASNMNFMVHNYFPTPKKPFVLNLASNDPEILKRSIEHCKNAIDLTSTLGAPFFSVHAGFCIHVSPNDLGKKLSGKQIDKQEGQHIFVETVRMLGEYASAKGVLLAIENNVVSANNLRNGKNDLLLGVTPEDLVLLMEKINLNSVKLLLDVAHLRVSANSLGFDAVAAIEKIAPWVIACHLSDNDGKMDTNEPLSLNSWFWSALGRYLTFTPVWVIEVYNIPVERMLEQINVVKKAVLKYNARLVNEA